MSLAGPRESRRQQSGLGVERRAGRLRRAPTRHGGENGHWQCPKCPEQGGGALQTPRFAHPESLPHQQPQILRSGMEVQALEDVGVAAQMRVAARHILAGFG